MGHPWKNKVACPDCGKEVKSLAQHQKMAHGKEVSKSKEGGEMTTEQDTEKAARKVFAEEKAAEEKAKREESEQSSIVAGIKGIGDRLDKMDADYCKLYPELCAKVDRLEEAIPKKAEEGSEEWKAQTKSGLEHVLFDDCSNCGPVRDEVLATKGKRLVDVEAEAEIKVDEEVKVEEVEAKVEEVEAKVEEDPELKTSPGYFPGSKWDNEKEQYVEVREG